jgi:hypothetical protein
MLQDHQFTDKAIPSETKKILVESFNQGFVALHKCRYRVSLQQNEIVAVPPGRTGVCRHRRVAIAVRPARPAQLTRRVRPPRPRPAEGQRRAAHVCANASALRSRGGLHDPCSLRDTAARGSRPSAEVGANVVSAGLRLPARSLPRHDGPAYMNREPERPPQGPGTREVAAVHATDAIPADGFQQPAPTMATPGVVSAPSRPGLDGR